jgi:hypothetical protein
LAVRIARETAPGSVTSLRKTIYGPRACDDIDREALDVIEAAYVEYRKHRDKQTIGRGL